jgi:NTE family protein
MKLGVALSGGGVRGAAHIGVLKALEEENIKIECISGTSAGSIVASLYSIGYTADEIEDIFLKFEKKIVDLDWRKILPFIMDLFRLKKRGERERLSIVDIDYLGIITFFITLLLRKPNKIDGFVKGNIVENIVYKYSKNKNAEHISQTQIPLAIPTVDINTAQLVIFVSQSIYFKNDDKSVYIDDALISEAVRASSSFPVVFKPKMIRGRRLVDGGIKDNVPANVLKEMGANKILAVNLGYAGNTRNDIDNIFEIASQSIDIMSYQISKFKLEGIDYVLKPKIYDVKLLETHRISECIERGYIAAKKEMPKIKTSLLLRPDFGNQKTKTQFIVT